MALDILKDGFIDKLLVVGHQHANLQQISQRMHEAGIFHADNSQNQKLDPKNISKILLKSKKIKKNTPLTLQTKIPKVWDSLATDLFLGNIDKKLWHWVDSDAISLLDYWKSIDDQLAFILLYNDPKSTLQNFLTEKDSLSTGELKSILEDWLQYNTTLLNFFYKNKDRALLINANQFNKNHSEYIGQLRQNIGADTPIYPAETSHIVSNANTEPDKEKDTTLDFLTNSLVTQSPNVTTLYEELQSVANIYDTDFTTIHPDIEDALCDFFALKQGKKNLHIAHENLHKTFQKEKIKFRTKHKQFKLKNKKVKQKYAYAVEAFERKKQKQQDKYKKYEEESKKENDLLLQQLHHVQEELEKYYAENSNVKAYSKKVSIAVENLKNEKETLEAKLHNLHNSLDNEKIKLTKALNESKETVEKLESQNNAKAQAEAKAKQENDLLLQQLHHVQEELEKHYAENKKLKEIKEENKLFYGAAERVTQQLSYRLGIKIIEKSKSFFGIITLPFSLLAVKNQYKKDMKNRTEKLPPIYTYADAYDAERVKKHLSYRLGETTIETLKNPFGLFVLPFRLNATYKAFKKEREI